jgi:hypothetical protein
MQSNVSGEGEITKRPYIVIHLPKEGNKFLFLKLLKKTD